MVAKCCDAIWRQYAKIDSDNVVFPSILRDAFLRFAKNGMQANPDKFNFMLFSPTPTEQQVLQLCDGTSLKSETELTVLGVTIDYKLCFSQHISVCCKKATDNWMPWHEFLNI